MRKLKDQWKYLSFPRHELPMPAQECRRTDNRIELPERLASAKRSTLCVAEQDAAPAEPRAQSAILGFQVFNL
jgi:hypothetical protein